MAPFFTIPKLCLYTQDESPLFKKKKKKKKQRKTEKKKKEPNTVYKQIEGGNKEKKEIKFGGLKTNSDASCEPASPALVKVKQKKKNRSAHTSLNCVYEIYTHVKKRNTFHVSPISIYTLERYGFN